MPASTRYTHQLLQLLPQGAAWPREEGTELWALLDALGEEYARLEGRGLDLLEEFDPRTTSELLADWERVTGLPGDHPAPPTTEAGRRLLLHAHLLGPGTPTPAHFVEVLAGLRSALAYNGAAFEYYSPLVAGSGAGASLTQDEWQHAATLHIGRSLDGDIDDSAEWLVERLKPLHVAILYHWIGLTRTEDASSYDPPTFWQNRAMAGDGSGVWVGVGEGGVIVSGVKDDFRQRTADASFSGDFNGVAYGNGVWVAVGTSGEIQTSPDGATWTHRTPGSAYIGDFQGVAYDADADRWMAVGSSAEVQISDDGGVTWVRRVQGSLLFRNVTRRNGLWVIVGDRIYTSPDGETFTNRQSGTDLHAADWDGSQWVAVGNASEVWTSPDGVTWTDRTWSTTSRDLYSVVCIGGVSYAAAHQTTPSANGWLYATADPTTGDDWTQLENFLFSFLPIGLAFDGRWLGIISQNLNHAPRWS